jgi:D-alanyl-D-alanine carboxypeptidase
MFNNSVCEFLQRWKAIIAGVTLVFAMTAVTSIPADAGRHHFRRHHRHALYHRAHHHHVWRHTHLHRHTRHHHSQPYEGDAGPTHYPRSHGSGMPGFAAIVVDGNSGRTLFARNEHARRHPASVTKVMTLYLLFEQLEKGRLRLNSPLVISAHAAAQAPTKLGLTAGRTIAVEDAIRAVVTKSANDIAVAIAENIGGDERTFAEMMTRKARALGMTHTYYANASGLPNDQQITTAYDLALLGRAIQDRFPQYFHYFSTHAFVYRGAIHPNHNHLLGRIEGVDGIKTGYTRASGFNLLTSVHRNGRHIVAVVLGGRTAASRDRIMAGLIEENIDSSASTRTARAITEGRPTEVALSERAELQQGAAAERARDTAAAPLALAPASPPPAFIPLLERSEKVQPAFVPGGRARSEEVRSGSRGRTAKRGVIRASADGSTTARASGQTAHTATATTPSSLKHHAEKGSSRTTLAKTEAIKVQVGRPSGAGWMIQIGATEDPGEANKLLSRARSQSHDLLFGAKAFTEKVQKGKETLWRARFAGLGEEDAASACKSLKQSGFNCFATRN